MRRLWFSETQSIVFVEKRKCVLWLSVSACTFVNIVSVVLWRRENVFEEGSVRLYICKYFDIRYLVYKQEKKKKEKRRKRKKSVSLKTSTKNPPPPESASLRLEGEKPSANEVWVCNRWQLVFEGGDFGRFGEKAVGDKKRCLAENRRCCLFWGFWSPGSPLFMSVFLAFLLPFGPKKHWVCLPYLCQKPSVFGPKKRPKMTDKRPFWEICPFQRHFWG